MQHKRQGHGWVCKMVIDQKMCDFLLQLFSTVSVNVHVTLFQDFKGCAGCFLGATAASPLNNDPFFVARRCWENAAPAHIFVEAQLEPDLIDPGSVFFEADFMTLS